MRAALKRDHWRQLVEVYGDRRVLAVLFLGFSSGLPIMLIATTLSTWLRDAEVSRAAIGLFGFAFAPYTFKFAWAPFMDRLPLPPLTTWLGRRRGWMIAAQIGLVVSIWGLGQTDPATDLWWTAFAAVAVAFFSASQDVVIDAYRVEILPEEKLGAGAGVVVLGYRIAMWVATAGALLLADAAGWSIAYTAMALLVVVGMATVLLAGEPAQSSTTLLDEDVLAEDRLQRTLPPAVLEPYRGVRGLLLLLVVYFGIIEPLSLVFGLVSPLSAGWSVELVVLTLAKAIVTGLGAWVAWLLLLRRSEALRMAKDFALVALLFLIFRTLWFALGSGEAFLAPLPATMLLGLVWWLADVVASLLAGTGIEPDTLLTPTWLTAMDFWFGFLAIGTLYGFTYFSRSAMANFGLTPLASESRIHLWTRRAVIEPFYDFIRRNGLTAALVILMFISVFKASDVVLMLMANPFYIDMGFSLTEIAWVSKTFGLWMTLIGGLIGGVIVYRFGMMRSLFVAILVMAGSNLMFLLLSAASGDTAAAGGAEGTGGNIWMLTLFSLVIMVENMSGGLGTTVFVAYLSSLCNIHYTAVQYALLTSFMQLFGKFVIVPSSGYYAEAFGWSFFFITSSLFSVPALLLLYMLYRRGLAVPAPQRA